MAVCQKNIYSIFERMLMERVYQETNGLLQQVHAGLGRLERCADESQAQQEMQHLHGQMKLIDENCERLDVFVSKEPPQRRHMSRMKVDQLRADCQTAHVALSTVYSRLTTKWRAAYERDELLKQRVRSGQEATSLSIDDHELLVNDRLQHSHRAVDDLINQGVNVLSGLRDQHFNLRGVRRRMLDIGSQLGLSNTTIQMIDKRVREDWVIFLVGCIFVCIFMYVFYRFWKG